MFSILTKMTCLSLCKACLGQIQFRQVAAGSNQKSLLFTGHIDGVDNIFSEKFWLLFSKANKLKINVNKRLYFRQIEDPEAVFLNF